MIKQIKNWIGLGAAMMLVSSFVFGQDKYPSKPVRIIVQQGARPMCSHALQQAN